MKKKLSKKQLKQKATRKAKKVAHLIKYTTSSIKRKRAEEGEYVFAKTRLKKLKKAAKAEARMSTKLNKSEK